jgi:uncharacterized protein
MSISTFEHQPRVGIAYSSYVPSLLRTHPDAIDYIEIPYELLRHDPSVREVCASKPVVLHCSSLSIAGSVLPSEQTISGVQHWIASTQTPWLGEHLSFIVAEREEAGEFAEEHYPGEPYNIGYTVSPPMNESSMQLVLRSIEHYQKHFDVPLLLENAPIYFVSPGSTMTQLEFIRELCGKAPVHSLLDLAHFYITSQTLGFDPCAEILSFPLDRVVEVHISGVDVDNGMHWDNHADRAPDIIFELLSIVLSRAHVKAITLEYNWSARFPITVLLDEIQRARSTIAAAQGVHA